MTATAFPSGWALENGTIGADADTSATCLSGGTSIVMPSTASSNASLFSDWLLIPDINATGSQASTTNLYSVAVTMLADSVGAGDDVRVVLETATFDKATITSSTIYSGPLSAVSTWEPVGGLRVLGAGLSTRWARVRIDRPNNISFNLYIDNVEVKQLPAGARTFASGAAFVASYTPIAFPAVNFSDFGLCTYDAVNSEVTLHAPGLYLVSCEMELSDSYSDGDIFGIRIARRVTGSGVYSYDYGSSLGVPAAYNAATNPLGLCVASHILTDGSISTARDSIFRIETAQVAGSLKSWDSASCSVVRVTDR